MAFKDGRPSIIPGRVTLRSILDALANAKSTEFFKKIDKKRISIEKNENNILNAFSIKAFTYRKKQNIIIQLPSINSLVKYIVLFEFLDNDKDLFDSVVKIYSNSPSFIFPFSYVYDKKDMFPRMVEDMKYKILDKKYLEMKPQRSNSSETISISSDIVLAILFMLQKRIITKGSINKSMQIKSTLIKPEMLSFTNTFTDRKSDKIDMDIMNIYGQKETVTVQNKR